MSVNKVIAIEELKAGAVILEIHTSRLSYVLWHYGHRGHIRYNTARKLIERGAVEETELPDTYLKFACMAYKWAGN